MRDGDIRRLQINGKPIKGCTKNPHKTQAVFIHNAENALGVIKMLAFGCRIC